jgi:hypothetical protein
MSLVEDLMREMQQLKDSNEEMKKKLQNVAFDVSSIYNICQFFPVFFACLHVV